MPMLRRTVKPAAKPGLIALLVAGASTIFYVIAVVVMMSHSFDLVYVATSSMEPSVPRFSLVLVRETFDPWSLEIGSVLVYTYPQAPGGRIMHRLIDSDYSGTLIFRGDAVENNEILPASSVEAVMVWGIPRALEPSVAILSDPGATFIVILAVSAIIAGFIIGRL